MGVTLGVLQNQDYWMGEGDEMIFVDGHRHGRLFQRRVGLRRPRYGVPFAHLYNGAPFMVDPERAGGRYCLYRWHADNPITFTKYLKYTIEHGHANHRADNYFSVAYWYQAGPYTDFPVLPPAESRIPRLKAVPGPGTAQPARCAATILVDLSMWGGRPRLQRVSRPAGLWGRLTTCRPIVNRPFLRPCSLLSPAEETPWPNSTACIRF
jgi:hypothetical protein